MKEDEARIESQQKQVMYVEKPDGSYETIETGSFMVNNYIDDFMEKQLHFWQRHCDDLVANKISSIAFYQKIQELTAHDVAERTGITMGKVKKHLTPKGFKKATIEDLQAYSELFDVPVGAFFQIARDPGLYKTIRMKKTENPLVNMIIPQSEDL
jgi:hypothetical protein